MLTSYRSYKPNKTDAVIVLPDGDYIKTLELPDRDNQVSISCIPEGQYRISRDKTGKHQWFKVNDVPGRTFIEMHEATKTSHLEGCIGFYKSSDLQKLVEIFGDDNWILEIVEDEITYNAYVSA